MSVERPNQMSIGRIFGKGFVSDDGTHV